MIKKITLNEELNSIFKERSANYKGKQINQLVKKQKIKVQAKEEIQKQLENLFSTNSHQLVDKAIAFYDQIFTCFLRNSKDSLMHQGENLFCPSQLLSSCLDGIYMNTTQYFKNMNKNPTLSQLEDSDRIASDREHINFLRESLYNPIRAELLFRGSDHNFQLAKFHEKCDGFQNTLTIVRTEFGKTVFAFAAQKWNSAGAYVNDPTGRSCLVLLDLKKKMTLIQAGHSIYCHPSYGPTFGSGHDLYISNDCDKNNDSFCNFPTSYNCNGEFMNNQVSYTTICGAPKGQDFKVIDYEVYKLIYQ